MRSIAARIAALEAARRADGGVDEGEVWVRHDDENEREFVSRARAAMATPPRGCARVLVVDNRG